MIVDGGNVGKWGLVWHLGRLRKGKFLRNCREPGLGKMLRWVRRVGVADSCGTLKKKERLCRENKFGCWQV